MKYKAIATLSSDSPLAIMHQSLLIVLVLGLSASVYALDLSHAAQPETPEVDPRIFNFINQLYADVVYPPLNHVVTST